MGLTQRRRAAPLNDSSALLRVLSIAIACTSTCVALLLEPPPPAHALELTGFANDYDPSNWTLSSPQGGNGLVDTSQAPLSVMLRGSNDSAGGGRFPNLTQYTTSAAASGTVSFDWNYYTEDGPFFDQFFYILKDESFKLTQDNGSQSQQGLASFYVSAGDTFGFTIDSTDDCCGYAQATISNFRAPGAPVSVPGPLPLMGIGTALAFSHKIKRIIKSSHRSNKNNNS